MKVKSLTSKIFLAAITASAVVLLSSGVAHSQSDFETEVDKVVALSDTINGILSSMTTLAVLPMGLSASMKTFKHIVLANV